MQLKDFILKDFLGEGSTSHVYLAEDKEGGDVALKIVNKLWIKQQNLEHAIERELLLHSQLSHENIVNLKNIFEDELNYYMVLEYCEKGSLSKLLDHQHIDEKSVKSIICQIVHALSYIHEQDIIHRDLKLSNIFLTDHNIVKISDFGLATRTREEPRTLCGTPNFIAPEILRQSQPYSSSADIWSLGCIMYLLLIGKKPFEGKKVSETFRNIINSSQLDFPFGFSSSASDLIVRLLQQDPTKRPNPIQILDHPWLHRCRNNTTANSIRCKSICEEGNLKGSNFMESFVTSRHSESDKLEDLPSEDSSFLCDSGVGNNKNEEKDEDDYAENQKRVSGGNKSYRLDMCQVEPTQVAGCKPIFQVDISDVPCLNFVDSDIMQWSFLYDNHLNRVYSFQLSSKNGLCADYDTRSGICSGKINEDVTFEVVLHPIHGVSFSQKDTIHIEIQSSLDDHHGFNLIGLIKLAQFLSKWSLNMIKLIKGQNRIIAVQDWNEMPPIVVPAHIFGPTNLKAQTDKPAEHIRSKQEQYTSDYSISGINTAHIGADGALSVFYVDGSRLILDALGSTVQFKRRGSNNYVSYRLDEDHSLPNEIRQYLSQVPSVIEDLHLKQSRVH